MDRLFKSKDSAKILGGFIAEANHESVKMISLEHIHPSVHQPRTEFDDLKIQELANSIKNQGVIQPIILKADNHGAYVIIAGERRYRAAREAGLTKIPAIIRSYSEKEASFVALVENIQREDLNPIDKAEALSRIIAEYRLKQQELAQVLGMSRSQLTNTLRLLKVDESVRIALYNKLITEGHAKVLAGLPLEDQSFYCQKIEQKGLSVRQLEDLVLKNKTHQSEDQLVCAKQTRNNSTYFDKLKRLMEEFFLTKVDLSDNGKGKGKVVFYYDSYEELNGLIDKMAIEKEMF